jgi:hypothetical protein
MESIYKHKQSGATQIMSDVTVEVLGTDEWEYLSEVDYSQDLDTSETQEASKTESFSEPEKPRVSVVNEEKTTEKAETKVVNAKAVSSKDLE